MGSPSIARIECQLVESEKRPDRGKHAFAIGFVIDLVAVQVAFFLAQIACVVFHVPTVRGMAAIQMVLICSIVPVIFAFTGLYPGYPLYAAQRLKKQVLTSLLVFGVLLAWNLLSSIRTMQPSSIIATGIFCVLTVPACGAFWRTMRIKSGEWGANVIIFGGNASSNTLIETLLANPELGLIPVCVIDEDHIQWGQLIGGVPVVGPSELVLKPFQNARIAIVTATGIEAKRLLELVERLTFPTVYVLPDLYGIQSLWTVSRDLNGILGLEVRKQLLIPSNRMIKRVIDCALASILLLFSCPLILLMAGLVKLVSSGPVFFRQSREGRSGKSIDVLKIRTMHTDAEALLQIHLASDPKAHAEWLSKFKLRDDPRLLPVIGKFMRRFSIDELPQLWNVLKGDMSLVGPRPFPQYHLRNFSDGFLSLRRSVTPGLTGLWQVSARSDGDLNVQEAQDTYYIRNWSLWFDVYLIVKTFGRVLFPKGAY